MGVVLAMGRHRRGPDAPVVPAPEGQIIGVPAPAPVGPDRLRRLELAERNAAMSSLGRNDEPTSTQVYLSTSPRKKRLPVGALLADDLGPLDQRRIVDRKSAPPSPR